MIDHLTLATTELHSKKITNISEFTDPRDRGPKRPYGFNIDHMVRKTMVLRPWCFDSQWEYRDLARFLWSGFVQDKKYKYYEITK